jgi:hypothetical protein
VTNFDRAEELRKERAAAAAVAALFVQACQSGNVATFYQAVDQINLTFDGWKVAMRRFAGKVRSVSPEIQSAFFHVWIKSKMLPFLVNDHRALCNAARVLFPRYRGPSVRLFRGAWARSSVGTGLMGCLGQQILQSPTASLGSARCGMGAACCSKLSHQPKQSSPQSIIPSRLLKRRSSELSVSTQMQRSVNSTRSASTLLTVDT